MSTPRLLYVVTHPMTARYLLRGQLAAASIPRLGDRTEADGVAVFPGPTSTR